MMLHRRSLKRQFRLLAATLTACCVMAGCNLLHSDDRADNKKAKEQAKRKQENITLLHAFVEKATTLEKRDYNMITLACAFGECHSILKEQSASLTGRETDSLSVSGDLNLALYYQMCVKSTHLNDDKLDDIRDAVIKEISDLPVGSETFDDYVDKLKEQRMTISAIRNTYQHRVDSLVEEAADIISTYKGNRVGMGDHVDGMDGVFRQIIFIPGTPR